jgi:dienelactone hydrolase
MILCALSLLCAQNTPQDQAIRKYLSAQAAQLEKDFHPQVKSAADFEKLRPDLRRQYHDMLGLWPIPEKTPLKAAVTGKVEGPGYTIEKVHFQSRPGLYVTANLYLPRPATGRYPAIHYASGHSGQGRNGNKTAFQDHGIWFASHGYVCLVTDTLQLGEIAAIHHGTYRYERWGWHSRGYTSAGVECWNGVRGVDYLLSRPEVDPERIGATGISGGGAATFWLAAADERVKVAVPVSGMADLGFYVAEDGVNGHCDCMFLYNNYRWNWTTIAALLCPRPLLFTNSDNDRIFPMSANERAVNRLERLYAHFGASDKVEAMVSVGGHAYRTDLRRAIFEYFNRHLKGDAKPVTDPDMGLAAGGKQPHPHADLRVFPEDKDLPADQLNTRIDETFVAEAKPALPSADRFDSWRNASLDRLREATFRAWPAAGSPGFSQEKLLPEPGIEVPLRPLPANAVDPEWLVVLNPDEDPGKAPAWLAGVAGNARAMLLQPRSGWTRKNPPNTIERSMALLGMTADSGRVFDVIQAAAALRRVNPALRLAGRGPAGIIAAYAALFDPSIAAVAIVDPPASHREGPHFLGVLKVWDIPEALGALAPRRLTLVGGSREAFDRTAELYRIAAASDKLERR